MKNYLVIAFATALAACGGGVAGGKDQLAFNYQLAFNSVTSVTIDVFSDSGGLNQVGSTITPPTCAQPVSSTTTGCFDPGLNPSTIASTTLSAATAVGATSFTLASNTNFVQFEMVTIGFGTASSEVLEVTGVNADGVTIATTAAKKAHAIGEMAVTAPRFAKFYGYSLQLVGSASPGTDYWISVKYFNGAAQVGLSSLQNVKVISGMVNTFSLSASNTYTSANGVVITASSGFVTYLGLGAAQPLSVTAIDPSGGTLSYAWTKSGSTCAAGSTFTSTTVSNPTFNAQPAAGSCTITVTVSSSNPIPFARKSTTINIANDAVVVANASPPQINQIVISTGNAADANCTLQRAASGCTGNACWPNVSCQQGFALPAGALNPDNAFDPQSYFMNVAVQASLGASGFNPSAPPAASATVDCANDLTDFPRNIAGQPTKSVSFPAGYAVNTTVNGNVSDWGSDSYFLEPTFTYGKGGWDPAVTYAAGDLVIEYGNVYQSGIAANVGNDPADGPPAWVWVSSAGAIPAPYRTAWAANWTAPAGWCTITVKVTNQSGGSDSVPVGVYFP